VRNFTRHQENACCAILLAFNRVSMDRSALDLGVMQVVADRIDHTIIMKVDEMGWIEISNNHQALLVDAAQELTNIGYNKIRVLNYKPRPTGG